jgi:hypothetical protein
MNNTYILLFILVIIFIIFIVYAVTTTKNNFENYTDIEQTFAQKLYTFLMTSNPNYLDYLDYLNENSNSSRNLVIKNNYTNLLKRANNNTLTINTILSLM